MSAPSWLKKKFVEPEHLEAFAQEVRSKGLTIATLNGSFDLMHAGHLFMIYEAKQQADVLMVALNSDESIRKYKSPLRPIIPLKQRLEMMAAIEFVDRVTFFEETDPCALISKIRPDVHVNGAEYGEKCIEAQTVREVGARLCLVPRIQHLSTSEIVAKIKQCV